MSESRRDWTRWALIGLLAAGLVGGIFSWNSEERKLIRRLGGLEKALTKSAPQSDLAVIARGSDALTYFTRDEPFALTAEPYQGRLTTSNDFLLAFRRFWGLGDSIEVILVDQELEFDAAFNKSILG